MYLSDRENTTKLVFNILILDLNQKKKIKFKNYVMGWAEMDSIRLYFNFIHKISITVQALHALL